MKTILAVIGTVAVATIGVVTYNACHGDAMVTAAKNKFNSKIETKFSEEILFNESVKLANNYVEADRKIRAIKSEIAKLEAKPKSSNPQLIEVRAKQLEIFNSTIARLENIKSQIKERLQKYQDYKILIQAKKTMLESMQNLCKIDNVVGNPMLDGEKIISALDAQISDAEATLDANLEFKNLDINID